MVIPLWCTILTRATSLYPTVTAIDSIIAANEFVKMDSICKEIVKLDSSMRNNEYELKMIYQAIDSISSDILTVFYFNKVGLCNIDTSLPTPLEYMCSRPMDERAKKGKVDSIALKKNYRKINIILGITKMYNLEIGKYSPEVIEQVDSIIYNWVGPFKIDPLK